MEKHNEQQSTTQIVSLEEQKSDALKNANGSINIVKARLTDMFPECGVRPPKILQEYILRIGELNTIKALLQDAIRSLESAHACAKVIEARKSAKGNKSRETGVRDSP